jgi:hypothetical protein
MNSITFKALTRAAAVAAIAFAAISAPASAAKPVKVNPPTLHGFCSLASPCNDNGTNTPTGVNPPQFGFSYSGPAGQPVTGNGDFWLDILVPNSVAAPGSFTITGALSGTASLFSSTAWISGQLDAYLGISASPTNPIGAYLPATQGYDPTATGFWVYQANLGNTTLLAQSGVGQAGQDSYLMQLGQNLTPGSYIVGFLEQGTDYGATANSGAILETGGQTPLPEPSTWAMMLLGFGAAGVAVRRSRKKAPVSQLA